MSGRKKIVQPIAEQTNGRRSLILTIQRTNNDTYASWLFFDSLEPVAKWYR